MRARDSLPRRRLLLVSQPLGEGVPQHVLDIVRHLDRSRYEIEVACPRGSLLWHELAEDESVRLHEIGAARLPTLRDLAHAPRFLRLVRRADVVHAHSSKAGFLARTAALLMRRTRRCVFTPHAWSFWAGRGVRRRAFLLFERVSARWCTRIVAVSDAERRTGLAHGIGVAGQYRVVLNGIDVDHFARERVPQAGRVLTIGRLAAQKRPDLAVEALEHARRSVPDASLLLVGDGPDRDRVAKQISDKGLNGSVTLAGHRADVSELLAETACLLLTSDYESCPYAVMEAMAAGVPVVATRVGGVPELVEDGVTGLLAEPGDPKALGDALARVLADPERARLMGEAGRQAARRLLTVDRMVAELTAIYDELVPRASASTSRTKRSSE